MDTTTVLEIIKIIQLDYTHLEKEYYSQAKGDILIQDSFYEGALYSLKELEDHLQSYIEAQVNAMENRTEQ